MLPLDVVQKWLTNANDDDSKKTVPGYFFFIGMTVFFYGVWYLLFRKIFHRSFK